MPRTKDEEISAVAAELEALAVELRANVEALTSLILAVPPDVLDQEVPAK